jgi:hypothetical protein
MHRISSHRCWWRRHLLLLAPVLLFGLSNCALTITDTEYFQRLLQARTDCSGQDIVGVWVSKMVRGRSNWKSTLLIRPDGTGVLRCAGRDSNLTWSYEDTGIWHHRQSQPRRAGPLRYDGQCLLMESRVLEGNAGGDIYFVFVRAEDEAAVEAHLRARQ